MSNNTDITGYCETFGHVAGNAALRKAAKRLTDAVRNYNAVSRYGGEEFLVVPPGCDVKNDCDRAEHIRHALTLTPVIAGDAKIPLTLSMGAATSGDWSGLGAEDLIRKADEAIVSREVGREKSRGRLGGRRISNRCAPWGNLQLRSWKTGRATRI